MEQTKKKKKGRRGNGEGSIYKNKALNKWVRTIYCIRQTQSCVWRYQSRSYRENAKGISKY